MAKKRKRAPSKHRASWRGMLRFGLVAFPVQAFNAHSAEAGAVAFHQLHAQCHSRIKYEKNCPIHGPVSNEEIVSGYQYSKGRYVEVEPEELDALRTERERSLTIDTFITPEEIDPVYFDGRMYYLAPDGDPAKEPYAVLMEALERQDRCGVGQIVFSGKDQVVLVRPYDDCLHMALLNYEAEMKNPAEVVGELPRITSSNRNVRLAEQLIDGMTEEDFDFGRYHDTYLEKVRELIDAKRKGREIVAPSEEEEPEVVNLMDALRQSIRRTTSARHASPHRRTKVHRRGRRAS